MFSPADSSAAVAITIDALSPIASIQFTLVDSESNPQPFVEIIFDGISTEGSTDTSVPSAGE